MIIMSDCLFDHSSEVYQTPRAMWHTFRLVVNSCGTGQGLTIILVCLYTVLRLAGFFIQVKVPQILTDNIELNTNWKNLFAKIWSSNIMVDFKETFVLSRLERFWLFSQFQLNSIGHYEAIIFLHICPATKI